MPLGPAPERWLLPLHLIDAFKFCRTGQVSNAAALALDGAHDALAELAEVLSRGTAEHHVAFRPHLLLLEKTYFEELRPILFRWLVPWLRTHGLAEAVVDDEALRRAVLDYEIPLEVEEAVGPRGMQMLNLSAAWLSHLLAHCLSKVSRVGFGLLQPRDMNKIGGADAISETRKLVAIPFKGKDSPSPAAEFAHPDVLLGLTILAYWYEGMRVSDMSRLLMSLKVDLIEEGGPVEQRKSYVLFEGWVAAARSIAERAGTPMPPLLPLNLVQPRDAQQLEALHEHLGCVPGVALFYLSKLVFPLTMKVQAIKISASGQELGSQTVFGTRIGFSGTPSDLVPHGLKPCHFERGSEGKILSTLTDPNVVMPLELEEAMTAPYDLLRMLATAKPPIHALIDVGASIMGPTNQQAVEYMLSVGLEGMDAAVFLDDADRRMVVFRGGGQPVPLSTVGVPWSRRFTFYDQVHTTGMDIKQCGTARAAITVSKDTILRDYAQGAWRVRATAPNWGPLLAIVRPPRLL